MQLRLLSQILSKYKIFIVGVCVGERTKAQSSSLFADQEVGDSNLGKVRKDFSFFQAKGLVYLHCAAKINTSGNSLPLKNWVSNRGPYYLTRSFLAKRVGGLVAWAALKRQFGPIHH